MPATPAPHANAKASSDGGSASYRSSHRTAATTGKTGTAASASPVTTPRTPGHAGDRGRAQQSAPAREQRDGSPYERGAQAGADAVGSTLSAGSPAGRAGRYGSTRSPSQASAGAGAARRNAVGRARTVTAVTAGNAERSQDRIVWIDCEMTGLDLARDALIEVAALVTDSELNVLGEGVDIVIRRPPTALTQMRDVVREMHTTSGLLEELDGGVTLEDAERQVLEYVREHVPEPRKAPLAGNSVGTDRGFLARDMPELEPHLHYRIVDVSSIKELARRWYPRAYFAARRRTAATGRSRTSTRASRSCATTARRSSSRRPDPDSDTARAIAATYGQAPDAGRPGRPAHPFTRLGPAVQNRWWV